MKRETEASGRRLYRLNFDCGRMGVLEGLFVAAPTAVAAVIGEEVYFGEVLGKHSDIYGELLPEEVNAIDLSEEALGELLVAFEFAPDETAGTLVGYNPLDYFTPED